MEGLINNHKDALLKRKRADEEIKESYDALLEGVRQERVQQVMDKMGDGVEKIEMIHIPYVPTIGYAYATPERNEYIVTFKDGTYVTGNYSRAKFHVDGVEIPVEPCNVGERYKYTDRRKLQRERVNAHVPEMRVFWKHMYDLFHNSVKRRTDDLIE